MFYFKAKKLHCGLYGVYSSQQKKNACQGYIWKHPAGWMLLENTGNWGAEPCTHTHVKYFDFQQRCDSSCYWISSVQETGSEIAMAPKGLTLMLESPYNFRLGLQRLLFLTGIFF